jgi:hypothetical protein
MIDTFVDYTHWPLAVLFIAYAYTLWLRGRPRSLVAVFVGAGLVMTFVNPIQMAGAIVIAIGLYLAYRESRERAEVARETAIYAAPQEGQYGTLKAGALARVLVRSDGWTQVQFQGWVRESDLQTGSGNPAVRASEP